MCAKGCVNKASGRNIERDRVGYFINLGGGGGGPSRKFSPFKIWPFGKSFLSCGCYRRSDGTGDCVCKCNEIDGAIERKTLL